MAEAQTDLAFVATDDLLHELRNRFRRHVFVGVPLVFEPGSEAKWVFSYQSKTVETCVGLCELLKVHLLEGRAETIKPEEDDE